MCLLSSFGHILYSLPISFWYEDKSVIHEQTSNSCLIQLYLINSANINGINCPIINDGRRNNTSGQQKPQELCIPC